MFGIRCFMRNDLKESRFRVSHRYPRSEALRGYSCVVSDGEMIPSARRFRFGGEKEAAGVAVAVMLVGIMEIECRFVLR